jgi:hypothetical protein
VKNSKKNSTYSHTNIRSYFTVEFLKKEVFLHGPFLVSMGVVFKCFWRNIVKELLGLRLILGNVEVLGLISVGGD